MTEEETGDPINNHRQLAATAADTLGLDTTVELVLSQDWGMEPEKGKVTVYCPPYREPDEHVLLHYLAHATMLENGWKQPMFRVSDDTDFLVANRSADSFADFWAYDLVAETFGEDRLLQYTAWVVDTDLEEITEDIIDKQERYGFTDEQFAGYCTAFALDWFAMAPVLLQPVYPDRSTQLLEQYEELHPAVFAGHAPRDLDERLDAVREQYRQLRKQYASYHGLLGGAQETVFKTYYDAAWSTTPPVPLDGFADSLQEERNDAES